MALLYTTGFLSPALKYRHYQKHILEKAEFPCASADEYEEKADRFLGSPAGLPIEDYTRVYGDEAGDMVRWHTVTQEYGVMNIGRAIITYFIANYLFGTNRDYFNLERAKDLARC